MSSEFEPARGKRARYATAATSDILATTMSIAAAGVLRRAALNAVRLNTFQAARPARALATAHKKPAAELTFKEAWLSDPATYPIVVIISSP